jgi:hypothetical protein
MSARDSWTRAHDLCAGLEGWGLFFRKIERLECPIFIGQDFTAGFATDADAIAFCRSRAAEGSELHALALAIHGGQ